MNYDPEGKRLMQNPTPVIKIYLPRKRIHVKIITRIISETRCMGLEVKWG